MFHKKDGTPDTKSFSYDDMKNSYNMFKQVMTNERLVDIDAYETMKNKIDFYKKMCQMLFRSHAK